MDKIQKVLIAAGRKDLAQEYYQKVAKIVPPKIKKRLEYFRKEIEAERISMGEIAELQSLAKYIDRGDVTLLEWAGVPEN